MGELTQELSKSDDVWEWGGRVLRQERYAMMVSASRSKPSRLSPHLGGNCRAWAYLRFTEGVGESEMGLMPDAGTPLDRATNVRLRTKRAPTRRKPTPT